MKILIIEDEFSLADVLRESLRKEGYESEIALSGDKGFEMAVAGNYDLILLDVMLPVIDGFEILRLLHERNLTIPVIMLTAKSQLDDKLTGFDNGADDYLTKPFEMQELFARIKVVTRRNNPNNDRMLSVGSLRLNKKTCELSSTESVKTVMLSEKEFKLLEYLMQNPRQILSRDQITERVWGYSADTEYNNVDVYISFIRKKIAFVESQIKLKAVRNMGYMLEEPHD